MFIQVRNTNVQTNILDHNNHYLEYDILDDVHDQVFIALWCVCLLGVLFTRDPLTGSPGFMSLNANYGLGEVGYCRFLSPVVGPSCGSQEQLRHPLDL